MKDDKATQFIDKLGITHYIADREVYFEDNGLIGIADPIQGFSSKVGPYLLCFQKGGILGDITYVSNRRIVVAANSRTECTPKMLGEFYSLRSKYGGLRSYTLPGEHSRGAYKWVKIVKELISHSHAE